VSYKWGGFLNRKILRGLQKKKEEFGPPREREDMSSRLNLSDLLSCKGEEGSEDEKRLGGAHTEKNPSNRRLPGGKQQNLGKKKGGKDRNAMIRKSISGKRGETFRPQTRVSETEYLVTLKS